MSRANEGGAPARRGHRRDRIVAMIGACALCAGIGYVVGRVHQDIAAATRQQDTEIALIRKFLGHHPDRYDHLSFNRGPWGRYFLDRDVRTLADLRELKAEMTRLFGEWRTDEILNVEISPEGGRRVAGLIR